MPKQKSKKIFLYFLLFLLIATINNKNFNNIDYLKINQIDISGLDYKENLELIDNLDVIKNQNLFFLNEIKIQNIIESNNLIEKYYVYKKYPSSLNIEIYKTKFLAKIEMDEGDFFLGSNGKIIKAKNIPQKIPSIFGEFNNQSFFELKEVIDQTNLDYRNIKKLFFFKSGRWDIELNDGLLIKLPPRNIKKSLKLLELILSNNDSKKINKIDLRQHNQIIVDEQ